MIDCKSCINLEVEYFKKTTIIISELLCQKLTEWEGQIIIFLIHLAYIY